VDDDTLERLRAFQSSLPAVASPPRSITLSVSPTLSAEEEDIAARLAAVAPDLATSYRQVLIDVVQPRETYVGPAGEVREVLRGTLAQLAPDAEVLAKAWFVGHEGKPTHRERIRLALEKNRATSAETQVFHADEIVEQLIGKLGRSLYERGSRALHAGTQQREVRKLIDWIERILDEVLPGPAGA
jgi:uncharacterized protein (DUF2164 family)